MKRICVFIDAPYGTGGTFQYNQQILTALLELPSNQFELTVFYVDESWKDIIPESTVKIKIRYPKIVKNIFKLLFGLGTPLRLIRFLYSFTDLQRIAHPSFRLVFFPSQDLAGLFLSGNSINVVYDLMHRYEKRFKESSSVGRGKFRDRLFSSMCKYSQLVIVDSDVGKKQLTESYNTNSDRIEILPYIAPTHITEYEDLDNADFFQQLKLPPAFIFYPAQYWPHKNHKILLEAANILKTRIEGFHLLFTGPKRYCYNEIFEYCKANDLLGNVTFIDYVPNHVMGGFYLRARAMVMPTYYGPTNIPPLEAIALKCPVAVSNIYGMPEQLGESSLYFDNTSVADVTDVLEKLWVDESLRARLKANCEIHYLNWNQKQFNQKVFNIVERALT